MNAIELRDMSVRRGRSMAVQSVSLDVPEARWFGVIGANGSGKTSLLRALAGRLECTVGSCLVHGVDLAGDRKARADAFGFMVPAENLPGPLTAQQLFRLIEPEEERWRPRACPVWDALQIERLLSRRIATCSAGMRQRIAVAAAFVGASSTIILDEPFNWLDPVAATDLRSALRESVSQGVTLMTALHDMISLASCDTGILLGKGKIIEAIDEKALELGRKEPFKFEIGITEVLRLNSVLD